MNRLMPIALALLLAGPAALPAADSKDGAFDIRRGFSSVAKKVTPAVVFIQVEEVANVDEFNKAAKNSSKGKLLLRVRSPQGVRFVLLAAEE